MYIPSSTYRIQFNKDFNFQKLKQQLPYLSSLGIGAIYASPVFAAVPGSNHGYDVTDPTVFNKEIGTLESFQEISKLLKNAGVGWIQDIVPNHMAFHPQNNWLMDVLEKGKQSAYAGYFDIDWEHPDFEGKVMVPILGKSLEQTIDGSEIALVWKHGGLFIAYYDFIIPLNGDTFHTLLEEYKILDEAFFLGQGIESGEFKADPAFKGFGWSNSRERFQAIYDTDHAFRSFIDNICNTVNSDHAKLQELMSRQHYVLTHWQEVENHLNYRRFFTINGLISLCMEKDEVFETYHAFIEKMVKEGMFQGLRIDHVDGLRQPATYFEKLRAKMGEETYIVIEKILERNEELEKEWPLQGTSGYDFLAMVNNIFTNQSSYSLLMNYYMELSNSGDDSEETIYKNKKLILSQSFRGDLDNISRLLEHSGLIEYNTDITPGTVREALGEFLIHFPVYRFYAENLPLSPEEAREIRQIIIKATRKSPHLAPSLKKLQLLFLDSHVEMPEKKEIVQDVFLRCMQYTGPLMAKGVEDTAMYTWSAFIAHNEVGDAIDSKGITTEDFHHSMLERRKHFPLTINATATHDTKRGEDSRARLNVLSDFATEWLQMVKHWMQINQVLKTTINNNDVPDLNEEYFIYQTLVGVLPMEGESDPSLHERLKLYIQKALREAKIHSDWNLPDETYEKAVTDFIMKLLQPKTPFLKSFLPFVEKIIPWGITNSLSQVVLKCTCPGIPDFYQGTELWDLSLVDPDNRREIDFVQRHTWLNELTYTQQVQPESFFETLVRQKANGKIKLWMTHKLMKERLANPKFFAWADYIPLETKGSFKENIFTFARITKNRWLITIIPLHPANLPVSKNTGNIDWGNTRIVLPNHAPRDWRILWNNQSIGFEEEWSVSKILLHDCPVVLKGSHRNTGRGSGILLHISSLPGKYGTGDLGEEAFKFVDFLKVSKQSYWQILPFNPPDGFNSPYSTSSAFAGNTIFIDPVFLFKRKWITQLPAELKETASADFEKAAQIRNQVIDDAFGNYVQNPSVLLQKKFEIFCEEESFWLDDFALFRILKEEFGFKPWNEWPDNAKNRNPQLLAEYAERHAISIHKLKFGQFLFSLQFKYLKSYANSSGIKIIGDIPIYIGYDSADAWSNPQLFNLDNARKMKTVAGVPPDYFSNNGQLWNMPIYNWEIMQSNGFDWWKKRILKNLEFCDILRLDHFRAFSSYWEVPAGETTAIHGKWRKGPGRKFFEEMKKAFPTMPFIAEDLGNIDEDVYKLRDEFDLPGMKVLQFAFGDNMPYSEHIPHMHNYNCVVYTGTHDNNTIKGWYRKETDDLSKKQLNDYLGHHTASLGIAGDIIRLAYASVARIAIIPIQDLMGLDESARLNNPAQPYTNWTWKLQSHDLTSEHINYLEAITTLYGR